MTGRKTLNLPLILWSRYTAKIFRWTGGGVLFLSLIISLAELFSLLWKFLAKNATLGQILEWVLLGIPKNAIDALPVALLFAIVFILSELHANNELEAIFGAGIALQRFLIPLAVLSLLLCAGEFLANDRIAVPLLRQRNVLQTRLLEESDNRSAVPGLMVDNGKKIYIYNLFDKKNSRLINVQVFERDEQGMIVKKAAAPSAQFEDGTWQFINATIYIRQADGWIVQKEKRWVDSGFAEPPASFSRPAMDVRFMKYGELQSHIRFLHSAGLPAEEASVELQRRLSFALTPLVVVGLAAVFAGRFRKSVFLLSLLASLSCATLYYVAQMIASLAAKSKMLSPPLAVWGVMGLFGIISAVSYFKART
jgi:lipopolysaccharide export system permease protein